MTLMGAPTKAVRNKLRRIAKHLSDAQPKIGRVPDVGPSPDGLGRVVLANIPSMRNIFGVKPLAWLGGKSYTQVFGSRKGRSGHKPEHTEAIVEDASRSFAKEVDKALEVAL